MPEQSITYKNSRVSREYCCKRCTKFFWYRADRIGREFCTRECVYAWKNENPIQGPKLENGKRSLKGSERDFSVSIIVCQRCNKEFKAIGKLAKTKKFCSNNCGPDKNFNCKICNKIFTIPYYRWRSGRGAVCSTDATKYIQEKFLRQLHQNL